MDNITLALAKKYVNSKMSDYADRYSEVNYISTEESVNLWKYGDVTVSRNQTFDISIPVGRYRITAASNVEGETDPKYKSLIQFMHTNDDQTRTVVSATYMYSTERTVTLNFNATIDHIILTAADSYMNAGGKIAHFTNASIVDENCISYVFERTAKDQFMRDAMLTRDKARFDDSFNYIAYSTVNGSGHNINTSGHYKWCAKQGFTALKGDVRPTSDGKLIMCHNAGFSLNSDGKIKSYNASTAIPIHDMTEAECLALQHTSLSEYVCSFDEYVRICKQYGKIAFITIRDEYIADEVVPELLAVLDKYNMRKRSIINSFTYESLQAVRSADDNITLHQVLNAGEKISIKAINNAISLGNCIISGFDFPDESTQGGFTDLDSIPEVLEYARKHDIRLYEAQVNSMEQIERLIEYGISGAQILIVPEF